MDTVTGCLEIFAGMIKHLRFNRARMQEEAARGFSTATDVADYLVIRGVPFRESHGIVGRLVAYCTGENKGLSDLTIKEFRRFYKGFDEDVYECLQVENAVNARRTLGGTAEKMVLKRIEEIEGGKR